ncbi:NAD(P)H-hydrate dehydratase [Pseudogracilibacillus sp. SO30301A]|uniref:NAD(P)H-hydrate dehydratase n=1 Tax=Pseudogracilibacillus sp. SO30301A TaxID=3098291 RepID=UPI00300E22F8
MQIYHAKTIKEIDQNAERQGFSLFTLMENAGRGLAEKIKPLIKTDDRMIILCGKGNNGGDGIVIARYLLQEGFNVTLTFPLGMPKTESAKEHLHYFKEQKFKIDSWNRNEQFDVIIDAILGIGTTLPLRENVREVISWSNSKAALRISVDVPTGVQSDDGETDDIAFLADYTFALHGVKPSAFLLPSSTYYGKLDAVSIGLKQNSNVHITSRKRVVETMPKRDPDAHKGTFGTSLLLAGSDEMPGSALLAAIGAIRCGTGKLLIGTTKFAASVIATVVPEATYLFNGLERVARGEFPGKITAVGIGPGINDEELVRKALDHLVEVEAPLVVDAGALLKREDHWVAKSPLIFTPHPGEFSRLTGYSVKEIQANRLEVAIKFAKKHNVILVLKGNYTVIAFPDGEIFINPTGNSGLAKGGSGDVLTGMIVSMLNTHKSIKDAVINAVYIHGLCAEKWAENYGEGSMVASDFNKLLPVVLKELV